MWDFLEQLFGGGFMPHGHCYLWTPAMVWIQVTSNALIAISYLSLSATLMALVRRVRLPFSWVYLAFGTFILACGITHLLDVATVWHPIYWLDAALRVLTAVASVGTAVLVLPLVPKVVDLAKLSEVAKTRGEKLESAVQELTVVNERLRLEQEERARLAAENATFAERMRTQEFQERFLAILGHDLRNPLAAIEMGAALLRGSANARDEKVIDRMMSSSARMSKMIEQILDLTRSRLAGGLEFTSAPAELCAVVRLVVDELRVAYPARPIAFDCGPPVQGSWDRDRLEQVFSNLIGNALQYGIEAPVTVRVRDEGATSTVTVHNDGPAIPPEVLVKLFDPFRRGSKDSRTSRTAGLGLGLFISHEIVAAHGGSLEVSSSSTEGTEFRVTLPTLPLARQSTTPQESTT